MEQERAVQLAKDVCLVQAQLAHSNYSLRMPVFFVVRFLKPDGGYDMKDGFVTLPNSTGEMFRATEVPLVKNHYM